MKLEGQTLRFTFTEGLMKDRSFDHTFGTDGTLTYGKSKPTKYASATMGDVVLVSYLSEESGYTLTVALDERTHELVAFSSNEKQHMTQHGKFEVVAAKTKAA